MSQKISFLFGPGGRNATFFWGVKLLTKREIFKFGTKALSYQQIDLPEDWSYYALEKPADYSYLPEVTISQIMSQSGFNFTENRSHHVLISGNKVVAQLSICNDQFCLVNDPKLVVELLDGDVFLGYLFTWPDFRKRKAAQLLLTMTENQLYFSGVKRIVTHIRATNVPSIAAFKKIGYAFPSYVISKLNGAFVTSVLMKHIGLKIAGLPFKRKE